MAVGFANVVETGPCSCGMMTWEVTYQDGSTERLHRGTLPSEVARNPIKRAQLGLDRWDAR